MAKTLPDLRIVASQIKEATLHGENTADRVGGLLVDLVDYLDTLHIDEVTLGPLLTALNNSELIDPADGQTLTFSVLEDNWTFSSAITQLKISQKGIEQTVASNYQVFLEAKTSLQNQIDEEDQKIRDNYDEYFTWKTQTDTTIGQFAVAISEQGASISSLIQTAEEITAEVQELQSKTISLADPKSWEQGTTSNEQAGQAYDDSKVDSTTRLRTKGLIPVTWDAHFTFTPENNPFSVTVLYFTDEKVYNNPTKKTPGWIKLSEQTEGKLKITDTGVTEVQYIAIKIKKNDESEITLDDLKKVGLNLVVSEIATYSEIKITARAITQAVSDSKDYTDQLKGIINTDVLKDASGNYAYATFKQQTNNSISTIAGKWDAEGNLIGYSTTIQTADMISSAVSDAKGYTDQLKSIINSDVLKDASGNYAYATFKQQTNNSISTIAGKWDSEGHLIGYSTTEQTATAISSYVTNTCYNKTQIDSKTTALTEAIAGVKITADSAALTAKAVENRRQNITDIEGWELGNIKNSSIENRDYDDLKEDSSQYVRTKSLFPFTSGNALFIKPESNYSVKFVLFNKDKKSIGNFPYSDVSTNKNGKITITSTDGLAYIAVGLKKNGSTTMTLNDVLATDISIVETKTVTSAEISTFITKTDDGKIQSGIKMNADMIDQVAHQITIDGDNIDFVFDKEVSWYWQSKTEANKRMGLDSSGNLWIAGEFKGGKITDGVVISGSDSQTNKMQIIPSGVNGATLVGISNNNEVINLSFDDSNAARMIIKDSSNNIKITSSKVEMATTTASGTMFTEIGNSGSTSYARFVANNKDLSVGVANDGTINIGGDIWPSSTNVPTGYIYKDNNGYLRVK